jgi:hypothetical protein
MAIPPRLEPTKSHSGGPPPPKSIKNEGRSGNVYENKGLNDKLTEIMPDICARSEPILQKIKRFEGQFAVNWAIRWPSRDLITASRGLNPPVEGDKISLGR